MIEIEETSDPPAGASETQREIWKEEIKIYMKWVRKLRENIGNFFSLVWGDAMKHKVEGMEGYSAAADKKNRLKLLKLIRTTAFHFQSQKYPPHALHEAKYKFYHYRQKFQSPSEYLEGFQTLVEVIESIEGSIGDDAEVITSMVTKEGFDIASDDLEVLQTKARNQYLATAFLLGRTGTATNVLLMILKMTTYRDRITIQKH